MKMMEKPASVSIIRSIISPESLKEQIHSNYSNISPFNISLLSIGDNDNYLIKTSEKNYVLRIYRHNKHWLPTRERFNFEFQLLNYLYDNNILVS